MAERVDPRSNDSIAGPPEAGEEAKARPPMLSTKYYLVWDKKFLI
jgi:hypothetical protein